MITCFSEDIKMCSKVTSINCSSGLPLSEGCRGGGEGKLSRLVYLVFQSNRCLHLTFSSVILDGGVGGKLSRLVYLAPHPRFG